MEKIRPRRQRGGGFQRIHGLCQDGGGIPRGGRRRSGSLCFVQRWTPARQRKEHDVSDCAVVKQEQLCETEQL